MPFADQRHRCVYAAKSRQKALFVTRRGVDFNVPTGGMVPVELFDQIELGTQFGVD